VVAVTLSALVPLLATVGASPARTAAGTFVTLVVVPALQALAAAFFGRLAAVAVGGGVALLTLALVVGSPPALSLPDAQRRVPLTVPLDVRLTPPDRTAAARALANGGRAQVFVCLGLGDATDVDVALNGVPLRALAGTATDCWRRYDVSENVWNGSGEPPVLTVTPRVTSGVELVSGYFPTRRERPFVELRVFARDGRLVEIWS
jgi:hypothetical protein